MERHTNHNEIKEENKENKEMDFHYCLQIFNDLYYLSLMLSLMVDSTVIRNNNWK